MPRLASHRLWFALLGAALWPALSQPLAAQGGDYGAIVGQISVARGSFPSARVKVTLETRGMMVHQTWTDNEGRYAFLSLLPNVYHIIVDDEQYQPHRQTVIINPVISRSNVINFTLIPKPSDKPGAPQAQVSGQNPYVIDAAYAKQFNKKVIKMFEAGVKEQEKGKLDAAIKRFTGAIAMAPDFYPAHNNLGAAYLSQGRFDLAQAEFETVLKLNQGDTQAYFNLGNVFLLTNRFDEAQRTLEEGIRRQPQIALGHFLLGTVLARTKRPDEAERELRKAQELDPLNPKVHLELVNLYLQQKKSAEAVAELNVFLTRFPSDPMAPRAREVLARLQGSPVRK